MRDALVGLTRSPVALAIVVSVAIVAVVALLLAGPSLGWSPDALRALIVAVVVAAIGGSAGLGYATRSPIDHDQDGGGK